MTFSCIPEFPSRKTKIITEYYIGLVKWLFRARSLYPCTTITIIFIIITIVKMIVVIAVSKDGDDNNNDDIGHTFFMLKPFFSAPLPSTLVTCKSGDPAAVSMRTKLFSVLSMSAI